MRRLKLRRLGLVSPLLDVQLPAGYTVGHEPIPFRSEVERAVQAAIASGRVRSASVYYRDLLDGPWFGVDEERRYDPASLMKVPVLVAWLKRAERDPRALEATFVFRAREYPGSGQALPQEHTLADGHAYRVEELLRTMMAWSDNRAMWLLYGALRPEELSDVLDSMDVSTAVEGARNSVSAHGFSGFLRILFNAAYLDRERSEQALELLALQEFPEGMVAGVPKGVTVAAKFGETTAARPGDPVQLHEFGIVYHRSGPYILGVMTEGRDRQVQAALIREISALVYRNVDAQAREPGR